MEAEAATLLDHILNQSPVLKIWVFWLMIVNTASVLFVFRHVDARWVLAAWLINLSLMDYLYETYGFVRLLGLSHVIVWTPLLVYVGGRWRTFDPRSSFGVWIFALLATNAVSLLFDYVDVARYFLGDGALPQ